MMNDMKAMRFLAVLAIHRFNECDERIGSRPANAGVPGDDVYA